MLISFAPGCLPRAYDSDFFAPVGVGHDEQPPGTRHPDRDVSALAHRVNRVVIGCREWIAKDSRCFLEGNSMFAQVSCRLFRVPLEIHGASLRPSSDERNPLTQSREARRFSGAKNQQSLFRRFAVPETRAQA